MCIDSVMVMLMLSAGDAESASFSSGGKEAGGTSHEVLIPVVRETEISVVLGQHLLDPTPTTLPSSPSNSNLYTSVS